MVRACGRFWVAGRRSPVASAALVPAFTVLALAGLMPIYYLQIGFARPPGTTGRFAVPAAARRTWPAWALAVVALTASAAAAFGGIQLLRNGFGMPLSWLSHTPFTGWALPGLALLIGVAMPQLAVLALIMTSNRRALAVSYLAGLALVAWILVQLLVLQRYFFLQPVVAGMGALEVLLAWAWHQETLNAA